jgi:broad specificity phosphatase PhoE
MTTRLTLICQGATEASRRAGFPADEPLEARAVAELERITHLRGRAARVSPAPAARQTAAALGLVAGVDAGLADADSGRWSGRLISGLAEEHPTDLAQWIADAAFAGHGGESRIALRERAGRWLAAQAGASGHVIAVTHAAVIRSLILEVLGAPDPAFWRVDIGPMTATDLRHDGRRWVLKASGVRLGEA